MEPQFFPGLKAAAWLWLRRETWLFFVNQRIPGPGVGKEGRSKS